DFFLSSLADIQAVYLLAIVEKAVDFIPDTFTHTTNPTGSEPGGPTVTITIDLRPVKAAIREFITIQRDLIPDTANKETGGADAALIGITAVAGSLSRFIHDYIANTIVRQTTDEIWEGAFEEGLLGAEEDPIWAIMRRSIFGTADQPPLTDEELALIVSGSTTQVESPPAEEGQPPQGPPAEEGQPPQPGEPPPPTPPAPEGQPPQEPTPTPPAEEGQPPQG
ncbi:MAG: hypothetical protein ACRD5H_04370, partial [Nitrososphaerales archaeon]